MSYSRDEHVAVGEVIKSSALNQAGHIALRSFDVDELPEADPDLTRRRYHFQLANRSLPMGRSVVTAIVRTREGCPAVGDPVFIAIEVVDSVVVVPNPVVIRYERGSSSPSRRVFAVDRTGNGVPASLIDYDKDLLRVSAAGEQKGSATPFDIAPNGTTGPACDTRVVFSIGNGETRELIVRLQPVEEPR